MNFRSIRIFAALATASISVAAQSGSATGTVTKLDQTAGRVTIAHEPIPAIKWPAMTMTFKVRDKGLLNGVKPGQKIVFTLEKSGSDYVVTDLK